MAHHANWIWRSNLLPWFEVLSGLVGYEFTSGDVDAVEAGVSDTDSEANSWFGYQLSGSASLAISVSQDVGSNVIMVRVEAPESLAPQIEMATEIAKAYQLTNRSIDRT